jgi:hypothetical protein
MRVFGRIAEGLVVALAWWSSSCSPSGFAGESNVTSVRVLASSADEPYAKPGDTVHVRVLAYDGRPPAQRSANPMNVIWIPVVCENPASDAYYACFQQVKTAIEAGPDSGASPCAAGEQGADGSSDAGDEGADAGPDAGDAGDEGADAGPDAGDARDEGADAGPDAGDARDEGADAGPDAGDAGDEGADAGDAGDEGADAGDAGADAGPDAASIAAPTESSFQFTMPCDVVASHPPVAGSGPYGLAVLFNLACAGRAALSLLPSSSNPQQSPIGCFDDAGMQVGSDDFVFGYTRVYSYVGSDGGYYANQNPVVASVDLTSCSVPVPVQGSSPSYTTPGTLTAVCTSTHCPQVRIGPNVPLASWETNPLDLDSNGTPRHEEIWADYYATFGGFKSQTRLLYDPTTGPLSDPDTDFAPPLLAPTDIHDGMIFIVVHDDRGGASWVTLPTHVCSDPGDPICAPMMDAGLAMPAICPDGGPSTGP